jgi:uncharacterized lipoprotein NlpE involved in copper resistance
MSGRRWRLGLVAALAGALAACGGGTPGAPGAAPTGVGAPLPDASAAPTMAGIYRSEKLPAADAAGLVLTLQLNEDGSAVMNSAYEGKGLSIDHGTWHQAGGTVEVAFANGQGTPTAETMKFGVRDGALVAEGMTDAAGQPAILAPIPAGDAAAPAGESGTQAAGTYTAALPAADAAARKVTIALAPDGTAQMSTETIGKGTSAESGTWRQDGVTVAVTLDQADGAALPTPAMLLFELTGGNLRNTDWDHAVYGDDGLGTLLRQP